MVPQDEERDALMQLTNYDNTDLIIVGSGWAGLSAATLAAKEGLSVRIFDRASYLGGRASSFYDYNFNEWLDNGTHAFIRAYTDSFKLLEEWNVYGAIDFKSLQQITWINSRSDIHTVQIGASNQLTSVLDFFQSRFIPFPDKVKTLRAVLSLSKLDIEKSGVETSIEEYLHKYNLQSKAARDFWNALVLAVMNSTAETTGVYPFAQAIKEGLIIGGRKSQLGVPKKSFKELYCDPAKKFLRSKGVEFNLKAVIDKILLDKEEKVVGVRIGDRNFYADNVLLAVQPNSLLKLLPAEMANHEFFRRFQNFEYSEIISVHFKCERPILTYPVAFLPDRFSQWVYRLVLVRILPARVM